MKVNFTKVERRAEKSFKCAKCGKRCKRATTIWNTVNGFNKAPTGWPKTYDQVLADVEREVAAWKASTVHCASCAP